MEVTKSTTGTFILRLTIVGALALLMLAAADLLWPKVSYWHEHRLALRLVTQLEESDTADCRAELRQITSLGDPAIEALVVAASSERADIALIAREIVEEKLASWKLRAESEKGFELAKPVQILAGALSGHVKDFGSLGQQWASRLSLELVELAADFPVEQAVPILSDCSTVLAAVPVLGPRMRTEDRPVQSADDARSLLSHSDLRVPPWPSESPVAKQDVTISEELSEPATLDDFQSTDTIVNSTTLPRESNWIPEWLQRTPTEDVSSPQAAVPGTQTATSPQDKVIDVPSPDEMAARLEKLRQQDTRSLLLELKTSDTYAAATILAALEERGIAEQELPTVVRIVSTDKEVRLLLVDDVQILSARTARRWLRELLNDSEAEVRLKALTAIATTNDPGLVEIARELAVRDNDPRVTELAARIMREAR